MYKLSCKTLGPIGTNCYTVINEDTNEAILIDATGEADILLREVKSAGALPKALLLTHAHFDHIDAVDKVRAEYPDIEVIIGEKDAPLMENPSLNLSLAFLGKPFSTKADRTVSDGEEIEFIGLKIKCIEVPGHTVGGMCYYFELDIENDEGEILPINRQRILFDGDTLFRRSIGRSDFPTGDGELLIRSIDAKLLVLPEDTKIFPGHDSETTVGSEKKNNYYFI